MWGLRTSSPPGVRRAGAAGRRIGPAAGGGGHGSARPRPHADGFPVPGAVDGQVEQGKVPSAFGDLQPYADSPDLLKFEGGLLADELSLVPGLPLLRHDNGLIHDWLLFRGREPKSALLANGR